MRKKRFLLITLLLFALFLSCSYVKNENISIKNETTTELKMCFITFSSIPKDLDLVNAEINKITKAKINATVKIEPIISSEYSQQINLKLNSNENLDMFVTGTLSGIFDYPILASKGKLYPLDDLIRSKGEGINLALGEEYLNSSKIHGKIYGVPTVKDMTSGHGVKIKKELLDKYKIDIGKIKNIEDFEEFMKIIHKNEPNQYLGVMGGTSIVDSFGVAAFGDKLVDGYGVLMNSDQLKVIDYYETPEYAEILKKIRKWYTLGYIYPGIVTNKENDILLMKENKLYGSTAYLNPLSKYLETKALTSPVEIVTIYPAIKSTATITNFMWAIPSYSKNTEKAMEFLNLMYTDKDIINLLGYGIEGMHYKKVADSEEIIDMISDKPFEQNGYNLNQEYMFGNEFISNIWNGNPPDIWKQIDNFNRNSVKSKAMGFVFDAKPVVAEYMEVSRIVSEYKPALENGAVDPEKVLPEFIGKLKAAGIDKIVSEKQKQLDEWAKNSK
ncbi:ABC transporter substrate-binding protein [Clostridium sp. C2-6-12]|uniref:ABC transporter substrate-binding protein n=1 Tax=Clostridium sp. C2-6-12 TaxID=2698832 RepID=UPI001371D3AF|nr:ABC transporter substrate-binding protein [Clostridium sp. C2-6-12]